MKNKTVLLINNNHREGEVIAEILGTMPVVPNLISVENGNEALHTLMGSSVDVDNNVSSNKQLRPDIILLDKDLPDMSGYEFLGIVRKYYSLENIKIFVLTSLPTDNLQDLSEKFAIAGYIQRPIENNPATIENFKLLKAELSNDQPSPLFSLLLVKAKFSALVITLKKFFLKGKITALKFGTSAGIKIASVLVGLSIIGGAAIYTVNKSVPLAKKKIPHTTEINAASLPADSARLDSLALSKNCSGLYILESGRLDLKFDHSLTYFSNASAGRSSYKSTGTWKLENDSTISALFFEDSSIVRYKIFSENELIANEMTHTPSSDNKTARPITNTTTQSSLIKIKGYYPDGKVEWAVVDIWERDRVNHKLSGNCIYYFPTGQVQSRGRIKNGLREGIWRYYDKSGKKIKTELYNRGVIYQDKKSWGINTIKNI